MCNPCVKASGIPLAMGGGIAREGYLVGYRDRRAKIYKIWVPELNKVIDARDVRFYEGQIGAKPTADDPLYDVVFTEPGFEELNAYRQPLVQVEGALVTQPEAGPEETIQPPSAPIIPDPLPPTHGPVIELGTPLSSPTADKPGSDDEFTDVEESLLHEFPFDISRKDLSPRTTPSDPLDTQSTGRPKRATTEGVNYKQPNLKSKLKAMIALTPENQTTFDKASHISLDELITPVPEYSFSTLKIEKIISPAPVKSFKEAKSRPELWDAWKPAFDAQIDSLETRKAFDL
ncbi:Uu.00g136230.m01.CDS01, partial [Anthostomella pinea]